MLEMDISKNFLCRYSFILVSRSESSIKKTVKLWFPTGSIC